MADDSRKVLTRRRLLAGAAAVSAVLGAGYTWDRWRRLPPDSVESYEMIWSPYADQHALLEYGTPPRTDKYDGPRVNFDEDAARLTADGFLKWGSSSCYNPEFWGFRGDDDRVVAVVSTGQTLHQYLRQNNPISLGCTVDAITTPYRLVVEFAELPREFVVEERHRSGVMKTSLELPEDPSDD